MIKKTLYFGNPAYLSCRNNQMVIGIPNAKGYDKQFNNTIPIEDIGVVVLDHQQITRQNQSGYYGVGIFIRNSIRSSSKQASLIQQLYSPPHHSYLGFKCVHVACM